MIKFNNILAHIIVASFLIAMPFTSMSADCDSTNVELTSKFRFLGGWDQNGTPEYLEIEDDEVSDALIDYVNSTLPESVKVPESSDEYFGDNVQLNTELQQKSKVYLTMVHEGAGWTNTLGYYTYDVANPPQSVYDIDSLVVIFPNVTQYNVVQPGNKVLLGEFPAETGIGYFLIAQGWVGDTICLASHMVFTDTHLNTFTTPEYQQQTILLNYQPEEQLLLCFEDIQRPGGDNDFNDAVFYITAEPGAIDTTDIPVIPTAHLMGDTTVCDENSPAELSLTLTGKAPWSVIITNGMEEQTVDDITAADFTFETILKDSIWIKSFEDARKSGVKSGYAIVNVAQPTATITNYTSACENEAAVVDMAFSGEGPWSVNYKLNDELNTLVSQDGEYSLFIEDNGMLELISVHDAYCEGMLEQKQEIVIHEAPTAVISGDASICDGEEATVQIELTGTAPFTIMYSDGENEIAVNTDESIFEFTTSKYATYTLISVMDAYCEGAVEGSAKISDGSEDLNVEIDTEDISCFGEQIELKLAGETDNLIVKWTTDGKGNLENDDQIITFYNPAENETGEVEFFAEVTNGCAIKTISKTVTIIEELSAEFDVSPDKDLLTNTTITFTPDQNGYDEYAWDFGDDSGSGATIASTEYTSGGVYDVQLTVNVQGCEASGSLQIEVLSKDELYIPNAFHPYAQNPENQVVKVYGNNIDDNNFYFKIINRWGKVMYETESFVEANTVGWDGVNNNNDVQQELNVFTYIVRGKFIEGESFEQTGTITQVK